MDTHEIIANNTVSEANKNKISMICYMSVLNIFAGFSNAANIGPSFSWEKFPDMAADYCKEQVYLAGIHGRGKIMEYAKAVGYQIALHAVKASGKVKTI